jgi:predicted nucleic acid-binding Zn ribbon protein
MSFQRIGAGLPGLMAQWTEDPELRWKIVERAWQDAAGDAVSRHAAARSMEDGVLTVEVDDPGWRSSLVELESEILAKLRVAFGKDTVRRIEWA